MKKKNKEVKQMERRMCTVSELITAWRGGVVENTHNVPNGKRAITISIDRAIDDMCYRQQASFVMEYNDSEQLQLIKFITEMLHEFDERREHEESIKKLEDSFEKLKQTLIALKELKEKEE